MERANKEHGRLSGVSVDGLADMCHDPNDSAEAFALVSRFHRAAVQYACPIIVSLHENPGSDNGKTRGHLGSELARKAETNLFLAKDGDGIVTMFSERSRSFCIPKATGPRFAWNDAAGMHLSCDMPPDKRDNAKAADMKRIFGDIFSQKPSFRHGELVAAYVGHESVCERTAKGRIKEATQNGIVAHSVATGLYSRGSL